MPTAPQTRVFTDQKFFLIVGAVFTVIGGLLSLALVAQALGVAQMHGSIGFGIVAQAAFTTLLGLFFLMNYGVVELSVDPATRRFTHRKVYRFRAAKVTEASCDDVEKVTLSGTINAAGVWIKLKNQGSLRVVGGYRNEALRVEVLALLAELAGTFGVPSIVDAHLEGWWTKRPS